MAAALVAKLVQSCVAELARQACEQWTSDAAFCSGQGVGYGLGLVLCASVVLFGWAISLLWVLKIAASVAASATRKGWAVTRFAWRNVRLPEGWRLGLLSSLRPLVEWVLSPAYCLAGWRCKSAPVRPVRVGRYEEGGRMFYRQSEFGPIFEAVPESIEHPLGDDANPTIRYKLVPLERQTRCESLLVSRPMPSPLLPGASPKGLVFFGYVDAATGNLEGSGVGWRDGNYLLTTFHGMCDPRYTAAIHESITLYGPDLKQITIKRKDLSFTTIVENPRVGTAEDLVAVLVPAGAWCRLGVSALDKRHYASTSVGECTVFGVPNTTPVFSTGPLAYDAVMSRQDGLLPHMASSLGGFSGSPVMVRKNGDYKIVGMHVAGCEAGGNRNYAIGSSALRELRAKVGLTTQTNGRELVAKLGLPESVLVVPPLARAVLRCESKEEPHSQADWIRLEERRLVNLQLDHDMKEWTEQGDEGSRWEQFHPAVRKAINRYGVSVYGSIPEAHVRDALVAQFEADCLEERPPAPRRAAPSPPALDDYIEVDSDKEISGPVKRRRRRRAKPEGREPQARAGMFTDLKYIEQPVSCLSHRWWARVDGEIPACTVGHIHSASSSCPRTAAGIFRAVVERGDLSALLGASSYSYDALWTSDFFASYRSAMAMGQVEWDEVGSYEPIVDRDGRPVFKRVATTKAFRSGSESEEPQAMSEEFLKALRAERLDFTDPHWRSKFMLPPKSKKLCESSLRAQMKKTWAGSFQRWYDKDPVEAAKLITEFNSQYPTTWPSAFGDFMWWWDNTLADMDRTKSSGWAACIKPGDKSRWLDDGDSRQYLLYLVVCRLMLRHCIGHQCLATMSAADMVRKHVSSPRILFTKAEAHGVSKANSGAWRQIWCMDIIDSLCQLVTHRAQNKADIQAYQEGKLHCQGVGLGHHDEGVELIGRNIEELTGQEGLPVNCKDASAWDLTVCRDAILFDAQRRIQLCGLRSGDGPEGDNRRAFVALVLEEAFCNSAHVVLLGDELWSCLRFGITASGIPSTSAQNSPIRSFELRAAGALRSFAVGDDALYVCEGGGDIDVDLLASFGVNTKDLGHANGPDGPHEFTSHTFTRKDGRWTSKFNNVAKMLAHIDLKRKPGEAPARERLEGCCFALRHNAADLRLLERVCKRMGWIRYGDPMPRAVEHSERMD